jgi:hypothetical protein
MSYYYLQISRGLEVGRNYPLSEGANAVGRATSNAIVFPSGEKSVSGHHAVVYKSGDSIVVQDLQSTNGTFVNDERTAEQDLSQGDEIGFGKQGPRARLLISEEELSVHSPPPREPDTRTSTGTRSRTVEDRQDTNAGDSAVIGGRPTGEPTSREKQRIGGASRRDDSDPFAMVSGSATMELEQRLLEKNISADDLHGLFKNEKRLGKIVDRGNIDQTQANMLLSMHGANRRIKKKNRTVLYSVIAVSVVVIAYFAIRAFQYKQRLDHGLSLEQQLDSYEKLIAEYNKNPDENRDRLQALIDQFDSTKAKLSTVKEGLATRDVQKFYSDPIERKVDEIMMRFGETDYHIPPEMLERVKHHIEVYSGRLKPTIGRYLKRREKYFPLIRKVFKEKNVPQELAYVSMLESGFNPMALSHAGARGLWQFMPHTGRRYGLRVNDKVDDRCDPTKATYAAAEYFRDLIAIFGSKRSVMLAMAAYNAGEGRVMGALRKIDNPLRDRDFWYIYRMGYLAEETNEYIPRIVAMMIIDYNREMFGFEPDIAPGGESLEGEKDFLEVDLGKSRAQRGDDIWGER